MSVREGHAFMTEYLTWMKPGLDLDSLTIYNFGYERPLPFPSVALTPDSTLRFNLQTSGMQTQSRRAIVVVGEKYLDRFGEIMTAVDQIHEDTQALPLSIYVETEDEIKTNNISSHVTPTLVRLFRASESLRLTILNKLSSRCFRPTLSMIYLNIDCSIRFIFHKEVTQEVLCSK